jgi:hypothetical protein
MKKIKSIILTLIVLAAAGCTSDYVEYDNNNDCRMVELQKFKSNKGVELGVYGVIKYCERLFGKAK